jgi:hypothetical protein
MKMMKWLEVGKGKRRGGEFDLDAIAHHLLKAKWNERRRRYICFIICEISQVSEE